VTDNVVSFSFTYVLVKPGLFIKLNASPQVNLLNSYPSRLIILRRKSFVYADSQSEPSPSGKPTSVFFRGLIIKQECSPVSSFAVCLR